MQEKPLLRAYLNEEVRDQVVAGDVLVAQMWAQVAQVAMDNSANLAFAFPAEGFALYADKHVHPQGEQSILIWPLSSSTTCCVRRWL